MLNLGSGEASAFSGLGGVAEHSGLNAAMMVGALAAWTIVPLALAAAVFSRREL